MENEQLADKIEKIHSESPDKGYRRLNDDLRHDHGIYVNDKRVLRICRAKDIRSTVKYNNRGCTRRAKLPQYLAENLLDRQFYAEKPNEKWLTDVTEFKWYEVLWSSFFVTLVAKKYRLATMLPFVPRMVCDSR